MAFERIRNKERKFDREGRIERKRVIKRKRDEIQVSI